MLGQPPFFLSKDMRLIQKLTVEDVPHSFDENQYVLNRPEAAAFQKTFCQRHKIPDRVRLYVHSLTQVKSFDFVTVRASFLAEDYEACYQALSNDLFRVINHPTYEPLGYWLVESAIKTGKSQELIDSLEPYKKVATAKKCLNVLLGESPCKLRQQCVVFYAFESSYTDAFKVSITSLVNANKTILDQLTIVVGLDPSVDYVEVSSFLNRLPVRYKLIPMDEYASLELKESYGHHDEIKLNKSAYYRIFLFKHLLSNYQNIYNKALYLDADTLVISSLEELFLLDLEQPLHAASEDSANHLVLQTKALNFLTDYFNSGVLLFDLQHPMLLQLIDKTIETAIKKQHRLVLQDQCALNIGFDGFVGELPIQYNYMLHSNPTTASSNQINIIHFTGRTKPWQRAYQDKTIFGELWNSFYRLVVKQ